MNEMPPMLRADEAEHLLQSGRCLDCGHWLTLHTVRETGDLAACKLSSCFCTTEHAKGSHE